MKTNKRRLMLIDSIRGLAILSMIGFHACWIMSYFGILISTARVDSFEFLIWERSICCTFIFISGFSFGLGRKQLKKGIIILLIGIAITILSVLFMYDIRDIFGILWILGLSPIIMTCADKYIEKKTNTNKKLLVICLILATVLLLVTWNINLGYLGLKSLNAYIYLPRGLYKGYFMTFLGFQAPGFYSVDYFSVFPWFFLYLMGYFTYKISRGSKFEGKVLTVGIPFVKTIGKYSLPIYLIHPVIIFILCYLTYMFVLK